MPLHPLIVVIDDDFSTCQSIERLLRAYGFFSCGFTSAADFQASSRFLDTACLILDVHMPGKGGLELQEELRAAGQRFPIIIITGYLDENIRERAQRGGAAAVLEKPFDNDLLINKIQESLSATDHPAMTARNAEFGMRKKDF